MFIKPVSLRLSWANLAFFFFFFFTGVCVITFPWHYLYVWIFHQNSSQSLKSWKKRELQSEGNISVDVIGLILYKQNVMNLLG